MSARTISQFVLPAAQIGKKLLDTSEKYQKEQLGYDFFGLAQGMIIFFAVAFMIKLYFDIVNGLSGFWINVLQFFRLNLPTNVPSTINEFMKNGYHGIGYWQIIKGILLFIVAFEGFRYYEKNKSNPNTITLAIFGLFIGFLVLINWDIFKSFNESGFLKNTGSGFSSGDFGGSSEGLINKNLFVQKPRGGT